MDALRNRIARLPHPAAAVLILVALAFVLRAWQVPNIALHADEYTSIHSAENLGRNLNGILFFVLLKLWLTMGQSPTWIRLLPVLIGSGTIPFAYVAGKEAGGQFAGVVAAGLFTCHPFAVEISQYIRQYCLFMLLSTAALALAIRIINQRGSAHPTWVALSIVLVLLPFSHFLGFVLSTLVLVLLYVLAANSSTKRTYRALAVAGFALVGIAAVMLPPLRSRTWEPLMRAIATTTHTAYVRPSGFSIVQFAKLAVAGLVFALGNRIYPLWLVISVPSLVVVGTLLVLGTRNLWRQGTAWPMLAFVSFVVIVFLILDPIAPFAGAQPRYALPAWPAMIVIIAAGAANHNRLLVAVGVVTLICLAAFYSDKWAYGEAPQDWPAAARFAQQAADNNTVLIYDGRSADPVRFYFPSAMPAESYWAYAQSGDIAPLLGYDRVVFLINDTQDDRRLEFDTLLRKIEEQYVLIDGRTDGSIKEYAFEKKPAPTSAYLVSGASGQVGQPVDILGLEFEDLRLPLQTHVGGHPVQILGAFAVPAPNGNRTRVIPLAGAPSTGHILLVSSVLGGIARGQVAQVSLHGSGGQVVMIPVRLGMETARWDQACPAGASCGTAVQWHKLVALVGQRAYPGAWQDFQATLSGVVLPLPQTITAPDQISFGLQCDDCQFTVWAIGLLP